MWHINAKTVKTKAVREQQKQSVRTTGFVGGRQTGRRTSSTEAGSTVSDGDSVYCDSTYVRSLGRGIWYLPIGNGDFAIGHRYIPSPEHPGQSKPPRQQRMSAWASPSAVCRCSSLCSWPHMFLALRFGFHVWTRVPWLWPFVLSEKTHLSSC